MPSFIYEITHTYDNNKMMFIDNSNVEHLIELPVGNYSEIAMTSKLQQLIQIATSNSNYTVSTTMSSSDVQQKKLVFDGSGVDFELRFNTPDRPLMFNLGWQLGFRFNEYKNSTTYISDGMYETNNLRYMYLCVDTYTGNSVDHMSANFPNFIFAKDIVAKIGISDSAITGVQSSVARSFFGPVSIEKMNIKLINSLGQLMDLNNMDYSFDILAECIYE